MATQGPSNAGTGADDSAVGTLTWTNPGNITASDDVYATISTVSSTTTHYLKGTNFGFTIPVGSTIVGIQCFLERKYAGGGATVTDSRISIVKSNGSVGTTNKSVGAAWTTSDVVASYGSISDLWGETWAASDINSSSFGFVMSASTNPSVSVTCSVDNYQITITYTPPNGIISNITSIANIQTITI